MVVMLVRLLKVMIILQLQLVQAICAKTKQVQLSEENIIFSLCKMEAWGVEQVVIKICC